MHLWRISRAGARVPAWPACFAPAALAACLAVGAPAPVAHAQGTWQQTEFVIGTGNDPVTTANPEESLRSLQLAKNAWFNVLTGTVAHTDDDHWRVFRNYPSWNAARLGAAATLGLKVFLANNAYTGALSDDVPPAIATWDPALPREVLDAYDATTADPALNDALWGYFLFDEPGPHPNTAPWVKAWVDSIHDDDRRFPGTHHRAAFLNFSPGDTATMNAIANDPDPDKRLDVASLDLYPFGPAPGAPCPNQRWGYFAPQRRLAAAMGTRPWWVVTLAAPALFEGASVYFCDPDANQLRFMAFGAAAAGAKGIVWMGYRASYEYDSLPDPTYALADVDKPNCKYAELREINHYLHDVVGPVAMACEHVDLFHQANGPRAEDPAAMPLVSATSAADCPAASLGNDNFAVGVFRPPGSPGEYFLLVVNKALTPQAGTVTLRGSWAVAAAPSVVGYVGGDGFSPLVQGVSFPVALAGGEGRLYHLTPAPVGHVALTAPHGGETWRAGETHTIAWSPASAVVDLALLTDLRDTGISLDGPAIPLASGVSGGTFTFTMPDVASRAARVVLTGYGPVTHAAPLRTAPAGGAGAESWLFGTAECWTTGALALGPTGLPTVAYQTAPGRLEWRTFAGMGWGAPVAAAVEAGYEHWLDGFATSLAVAPDGGIHVASAAGGLERSANARTVRHHFGTAPGPQLEPVGAIAGGSDLAIATTAAGGIVVAGADSAGLIVRHRGAGGWETWGSPVALPDVRGVSLAVDAQGHAWVAFTCAGAGGLRDLAVYDVTASASTASLFLPGQGGLVSLALDPAGRPAIASAERLPDGGDVLRYAVRGAAGWSAYETVDARPAAIASIALAFDGGSPAIAYVANHVALYARRGATAWAFETVIDVDAEGPVRLACSPVTGDRWVMFFDRAGDGMRVVRRPTSRADVGDSLPGPARFAVALRSANPARAGTPLEFELRLPRAATVGLALFDLAGRRVATLPARRFPAGVQALAWAPGAGAPGAYFLRVERDGAAVDTRRLILLR